MLSADYLNEDLHRAAANHAFLTRFVGSKREVMQFRFARSHRRLRLGPNLRFDAAAADGSGNFAALKEEHLRAALLRSRTARVRHRRHDDPLAAVAGLVDHAIQLALGNRGHFGTWYFVFGALFLSLFTFTVYSQQIKVQSTKQEVPTSLTPKPLKELPDGYFPQHSPSHQRPAVVSPGRHRSPRHRRAWLRAYLLSQTAVQHPGDTKSVRASSRDCDERVGCAVHRSGFTGSQATYETAPAIRCVWRSAVRAGCDCRRINGTLCSGARTVHR